MQWWHQLKTVTSKSPLQKTFIDDVTSQSLLKSAKMLSGP